MAISPEEEIRLMRLARAAWDAGDMMTGDRYHAQRLWRTDWSYPSLRAARQLEYVPGVRDVLVGPWVFPRPPHCTLMMVTPTGAWHEFADLRALNPGLDRYHGRIKDVVLGVYSRFNWDDIEYFVTDYKSGDFDEQRRLEKEIGLQLGWVLSPKTMDRLRDKYQRWMRIRRRLGEYA